MRKLFTLLVLFSSFPLLLMAQSLTYSTYLGGTTATQGDESFAATSSANAVAMDGSKNVYVVGFTSAVDFPITPGAYDSVIAQPHSRCCGAFSSDEFLAKFSPSGTLLYSTFLGPGLEDGNFEVGAPPVLAVDSAGNAYVASTGTSCDDCGDQVVTIEKVDPTGSKLLYSSVLNLGSTGNADLTTASGIAADNAGHLYVAGNLGSSYLTPDPAGNRIGSKINCYVVKLDTNQTGTTSVVYATFMGASPNGFQNPPNDIMGGIAVDSLGDAYVTGTTPSAVFPHTVAYGTGTGGAFIMKLDPTGSSYLYSALVGGVMPQATAIALDHSGNAYVTGAALADGFPRTPNASQLSFGGGTTDAFLLKVSPTGGLVYSTYVGGVGDDVGTSVNVRLGYAAIAGYTNSSNFPVSPDAVQQTFGGGGADAFLSVRHGGGKLTTIYSTYLGGNGSMSPYDQAAGIALGTALHVYVVGTTTSLDFPVTPNALQSTFEGAADGFLSREAALIK